MVARVTGWREKIERLIDACDGSREQAGAKIGATLSEVYSYGRGLEPPSSIQQAIDRALTKLGIVIEEPVPPAVPVIRKEVAPVPKETSRFHPKDCVGCGKEFTPSGPRAIRCDRCKTGKTVMPAPTAKPAKAAMPPKPAPSGTAVPAVRRSKTTPTPKANGHDVAPTVPSPGLRQPMRDLSTRSLRASELFANIARDSAELAELLG
jgi:DNA-directed RNA polymerase subunit RPC12/RpoP